MRRVCIAVALFVTLGASALAADPPKPDETAAGTDEQKAKSAVEAPRQKEKDRDKEANSGGPGPFKPDEVTSEGSVTVGGARIEYTATTGTLVVHPRGWDDASPEAKTDEPAKPGGGERPTAAEASMFYVAYFQKGARPESRPVTFLYNGGPGWATLWLHMGAFGPRRVVATDENHAQAAPYAVLDNDASLLDASDLVFIDAPGTGFSRIAGKDKDKAFLGIDADAYAFSDFIVQFLTKYGRWNSPKYLFGESYGTTRSAVLGEFAGDQPPRRRQRRDPIIADSQFRRFARWAGQQSRQRPALRAGLADVRGRCLVLPQGSGRAESAEAAPSKHATNQ